MDAAAHDALRRCNETVRLGLGRSADESVAFPDALAYRTPSLPDIWTLNQLRITGALEPGAIVALADELQGALSFRHVVIEDPGTAAAAEAALSADAGWRIEHDLLMRLGGDHPSVSPAPDASELSEPEMLELMSCWFRELQADASDDVVRQFTEFQRREHRAWGERVFGMRAADGAPVAITKLRTDGGVAWVEDVFTRPHARRQGLGRALVAHVLACALALSPELVFLGADGDGWPQHLYGQLGFEPLATGVTLHRSD